MRVPVDFFLPRGVPENHCWIDLSRPELHALAPRIEVVPLQLKRPFTRRFPDRDMGPASSGGLVRRMTRTSGGTFAEKKH